MIEIKYFIWHIILWSKLFRIQHFYYFLYKYFIFVFQRKVFLVFCGIFFILTTLACMLYFLIAHDIATFFLIHKILLNRSYIPFFNGACLSRISVNAAWKSSHFSISDQQFWFWFLKNKTFMWVIRTTQRDFLFMKIEFNSKSFKVL